eukprot:10570990-Karenia_brevis.AAC.1
MAMSKTEEHQHEQLFSNFFGTKGAHASPDFIEAGTGNAVWPIGNERFEGTARQYGKLGKSKLRIHAIFPERRFPGQRRNCGSAPVMSEDRTQTHFFATQFWAESGTDQ